MLDIFDIFLL